LVLLKEDSTDTATVPSLAPCLGGDAELSQTLGDFIEAEPVLAEDLDQPGSASTTEPGFAFAEEAASIPVSIELQRRISLGAQRNNARAWFGMVDPSASAFSGSSIGESSV